ncbi:hypothetical protein [Diaphorobacter aerolatus]|nr:hypothetical protein [Diaphorobacter aerolatus]
MRAPRREHFGQRLRRRNALVLHGWVIGVFMMAFMWSISRFQWMLVGDGSLALRYLVTLGSGYLVYLLVLYEWSRWVLLRESREEGHETSASTRDERFADAVDIADTVTSHLDGSMFGDLASGALEAVGAADEGAIVVVPVVAIFVAVVVVASGAGALMWLYFGSDVLLAVAVELAFSIATARALMGAERAGWLSAAVHLTWKPLLGALVCAVVLGGLIDHFVPEARSLSEALRLWRGH